MKLRRAHRPGTVKQYETINFDLLGIALSRVLKGRTVSDYLSEKIWRPAGMEADANWVLDKAGIERGGCCISATLRDYARFFLSRRAISGPREPCCRLVGSITPISLYGPLPTMGLVMAGAGGCVRTAVTRPRGAYGQSVTIYPKDDVVIAVNAASRDPHGFGIARLRLLQALDAAAVGRSDPNDKAQ